MSNFGKIALALTVTLILGYFAWIIGFYGVIGVKAAFEEGSEWTLAGMVYWALLFASMTFSGVTVLAWLLLFRSPPNHHRSNQV